MHVNHHLARSVHFGSPRLTGLRIPKGGAGNEAAMFGQMNKTHGWVWESKQEPKVW